MIFDKREQSINGWYVPVNPYEGRDYGFKPLSEVNNSHTFKVYLCTTCNRVHENAWESGVGGIQHYYEDFPTLGLQRIKCRICDGNEKN